MVSEASVEIGGLGGHGVSEEVRYFYDHDAHYRTLWEFVRDLLKMEEYNPSVLRWEPQEGGVFRVIDSVRLGRLCAKVKGNKMEDYRRINMVIHEYAGKGKIETVDNVSLIYKFGPQAIGCLLYTSPSPRDS